MTVANDTLSIRYTGSYSHASNYHTGGDGKQVRSTSYLSFNHAATVGFQKNSHLLAVTFGQQNIPYEGFPNQYGYDQQPVDIRERQIQGDFDWGTFEARGFWQRVTHAMDMMNDKGGHSATTGMPMNTDARTAGYLLKAEIPLGLRHTLRLGSSFDHNGLNDWWPPYRAA